MSNVIKRINYPEFKDYSLIYQEFAMHHGDASLMKPDKLVRECTTINMLYESKPVHEIIVQYREAGLLTEHQLKFLQDFYALGYTDSGLKI